MANNRDAVSPRELEAMQVAYNALRGQDASIENRMLAWLTERLAEDKRTREAKAHTGPTPTYWVANGNPNEILPSEERSEAIEDADADSWTVIDVCGLAIVKQEFVVPVMTDDGREFETFATRAEAEDYVKRMTA